MGTDGHAWWGWVRDYTTDVRLDVNFQANRQAAKTFQGITTRARTQKGRPHLHTWDAAMLSVGFIRAHNRRQHVKHPRIFRTLARPCVATTAEAISRAGWR